MIFTGIDIHSPALKFNRWVFWTNFPFIFRARPSGTFEQWIGGPVDEIPEFTIYDSAKIQVVHFTATRILAGKGNSKFIEYKSPSKQYTFLLYA